MSKSEFPGPGLSTDHWPQINALAANLTSEQAIWISGYFADRGHSVRSATASDVSFGGAVSPHTPAPYAALSRSIPVLFASETDNSAGLARPVADAAKAQGIPTVQLCDMADYKLRRLKEEPDLPVDLIADLELALAAIEAHQ